MMWVTYEGVSINVQEMTDSHVANAVKWFGTHFPESKRHKVALAEAHRRNLNKEFMKGAPYPHTDLQGRKVLNLNDEGRPIFATA